MFWSVNAFDGSGPLRYECAMAKIVSIGQPYSAETLLDFIARQGAVNTVEVGMRFGWDTKTARKELSDLKKAGKITNNIEHVSNGATVGRVYTWQIKQPD